MGIVFAVIGLLVGLQFGRHGGWLYGGLSGLALGLAITLRMRLRKIERELLSLRVELAKEQRQQERARAAEPAPPAEGGPEESPAPKRSAEIERETPSGDLSSKAAEASVTRTDASLSSTAEPASSDSAAEPPTTPQSAREVDPWAEQDAAPVKRIPRPAWLQTVFEWFTGGNLMVRVGVVVLFFGVAFALKFAAEHALLPMELRLAGIAAGGIVMLLLGWRLRQTKRTYGLVLQGGAVGILYLTIFAALRLYQLVPPGMALVLLMVFAAFSAGLALMQNAAVLAILGAIGGFLAPVLTSTGGGSHVQLFGYYVILNLGILAIAWYRAWRVLNLVGFGFTFVIAALWGARYYRPEFFATTEPFLVVFVLMYVAIAVLYAFRQPVELRGLVDGTLVFGVPLVGFGLQASLLRDSEFGLAWSALVAAGFYVLLAWQLFIRLKPESRLLAEAFLALGVGFATLAVPLALDAQWTAGAWALEGAALVWVGVRQSRLLPRASGYLLQLGGGVALLSTAESMLQQDNQVTAFFTGALIVALAGLFSSWYTTRRSERLLTGTEDRVSVPLFAWGLSWWYGGWLVELSRKLTDEQLPLAVLLLIAVSALLATVLRDRLDWRLMRYPALAVLTMAVVVLAASVFVLDHPFEHGAWIGWLAVYFAHYRVLRSEQAADETPVEFVHMLGVWLALAVATWAVAWWLDKSIAGADTWWRIAFGLVPAAGTWLLLRRGERLPWPVHGYPEIYTQKAPLPIIAGLWLWVLAMLTMSRGSPAPLGFLPFINPMDVAVGLVMLLLLAWIRGANAQGASKWIEFAPQVFAFTVFVWLNSMWFRTAHFWLDVPFSTHRMLESQAVQSGLALLWSVCGLGAMVAGARRGIRQVWFVGAGLMAVVVAKLFLVDLSNTGTMARIVSFMGVGVLLLAVGYFAPVPPRKQGGD